MKELVSVIVPVYNVEKYLDKCLYSIAKQTYQNLEIILVNDGSTDSCYQICDTWAEKDSRIRVIHKENGGLSQARNCALERCTGNYVVFVDSDDYIDANYIEYLYMLLVQNDADISVCNIQLVNQEGKRLNKGYNSTGVRVMDRRTALEELCQNKQVTNSASGKMVKRSVISGVCFPEGSLFEDIATVYKWFMHASRIVWGNNASYYYVQRSGSIVSSEFSPRRLDAVVFVEQMCDEIEKEYPDLHTDAQKRRFVEYMYVLRSLTLSKFRDKNRNDYEKMLFAKIKITRKKAWKRNLTRKQAYYAVCSCFGRKFLQLGFILEDFVLRRIKR